MLERDYYGHVSPEGATARDRFLEVGGSRWQVVAENIARCDGCETPIAPEQVRSFQSGWMQSPGHRDNIPAPGIGRFGFGVAAADCAARYRCSPVPARLPVQQRARGAQARPAPCLD